MEISRIEDVKTEVIIDVLCDSCGKSCKKEEHIIDNEKNPNYGKNNPIFEYMTLEANWGYCSNKDCETWKAQICEECIDTKFKFITFKKSHYL
jgi:hypothetical protein